MAFYKRIACGVLSVLMILSFTACSSSGETIKFQSGKQRVVMPKNEGEEFHKTTTDSLELICGSGLTEMYFDKKSYSVAIKDTSKGNIWYSMPTESVNDASVLSLDVAYNGAVYKLNSQDNSVAFEKAKYEKKNDGVWVSYTLSEKKEKSKISIPITVKYVLKDGSLFVDIDCKKLATQENLKVESLELLKYFGASKEVNEGNFMLLPDGCGAKINTDKSTQEQNYSVKIYGEDYSATNSVKHTGVVPAFGAKSGQSAFGAVIQKGDALSTVMAKKASQGEYNTIWTSFAITPTSKISDKDSVTEKTISNSSYDSNISMCYRFLTGSSATYSGIASICREQLIRDAVLSTKTVEGTGSYPVNISLVGMAKYGGIKRNKLTTFEQSLEIVQLLKAKGIDNLNIRYKGAFSDGTSQSNIRMATLNSSIGSKKDVELLNEYMVTQDFGLFFDINMLTMSSGLRAKDIRGKKSSVNVTNELNNYWGPKTYETNLANPQRIEKNVTSFLANMRDLSLTGFCVNDAGSILYSHFGKDMITREDVKSIIQEEIISLSTNKQTMADTGNFFMLKNVDYIVDIPMDTTYKQSKSYEAIPFIQMILHGMLEYSGAPANLSSDYTYSFLKSIEYGSMLAFEMTFDDIQEQGKNEGASTLSYEEWAPKAAEGYKEFNNLFADLRDARMTDHYLAQENLYCTVYNNGTYIYVNYSKDDITYKNLIIKANSYLRVN